jgi:hypothetical protein
MKGLERWVDVVRMGAVRRTFGDMGSFLYFLPYFDGRLDNMGGWVDESQ